MALKKREFLPEKSDAFGRGGRDLYNIIISRGEWAVIGQMKNPFSLSLEAEWADLLDGSIPGTELLKKLGNTELATGMFTQKYFSKGGYFNINVDFRILEDMEFQKKDVGKKTSKVVQSARSLGNLMLPKESNFESFGQLADKAGQLVEELGDKGASTFIKDKLVQAGEGLKNSLTERTIDLKIGNYFHCSGMIITSFKVDYSKEHILNVGPMYGDFSLTLQSIQAAHQRGGKFGIDSCLTEGTNRITFTRASKKTQNIDTQQTQAQRIIEDGNPSE